MELFSKYGYSLVFVVMLLEQLGVPVPVAPVLLLGGALAASGTLSAPTMFLLACAAALLADLAWYFAGKRQGRRVLLFLCHASLSPESCARRTEDTYHKYGMNSLLFAKFVPGLNTVAPPLAGMFRQGLSGFLWRDAVGTAAYVLSFLLIGFIFEKRVFEVTGLFQDLGRTFFWLVVGALGTWMGIKYLRLKLLQRILYRERISIEELLERQAAGEDLIIVDIRKENPHGKDRVMIPKAVRIPPGEIDRFEHQLDKDRWIVMYCT